jgi:uncharacterized protein YdeI (YjbR/CyaY-like superfamily)
MDRLPVVTCAEIAAWADWLAEHHHSAPGVWLKLAKKGRAHSIDYQQALEQALAWGWIDGQKRALDDRWWLQKFTPRRPGSVWSKINRDKALALIAAGKMQPAGLAAVERARQDGQWERAYAGQKGAPVPPDLQAALRGDARAAAAFATLDARNRYAILYRIGAVKKAETRARRIAGFVTMLAAGRLIYPAAVKRESGPRGRRPPGRSAGPRG